MSQGTVDIRAAGQSELLAGKLSGDQARPEFEKQAQEIRVGSVVLLDLSQVELLTGSYYLSALRPVFWEPVGVERDLYPIFYQANVDTEEDILLALRATGVPGLFADGSEESLVVSAKNMDGQARETFDLVVERGMATAGDLFKSGDSKIRKTGWSNRLALLHQHRILRRWKQGRELVYGPCWRS